MFRVPYKVITKELFISQVSPAQPTGGRRRRATEMHPDERRERFLERNRAAASRCRQKRKIWVNSLEKKADDLASMNVSLTVGLQCYPCVDQPVIFAQGLMS